MRYALLPFQDVWHVVLKMNLRVVQEREEILHFLVELLAMIYDRGYIR